MLIKPTDAKLHTPLQTLAKGYHYTVIYLTTPLSTPIQSSPSEGIVYQSEFQNLEHLDLRRELRIRVPPETNATDVLPLFEKYQFLTPGKPVPSFHVTVELGLRRRCDG